MTHRPRQADPRRPALGGLRRTAAPDPAMGGEVPPDSGEAGFVLVSVLAVVALFVTVAVGFAVSGHLHLLQAERAAEAARAEALVDGVALLVADRLGLESGAGAGEPPIPRSGEPVVCRLAPPGPAGGEPGGQSVRIRLADPGGLIDLNAAPPEMMRVFFAAAGVGSGPAAELAREIASVRDRDEQDARGVLRHGPFRHPDEVRSLRNGATAVRLLPLLTVDNPVPSVDLDAMPYDARTLLPRDAAQIPELRNWVAQGPRETVEIDVALFGREEGARALRVAIVNLGTASGSGMRIRTWSRPPFERNPDTPAKVAQERPEHGFCKVVRSAFASDPKPSSPSPADEPSN